MNAGVIFAAVICALLSSCATFPGHKNGMVKKPVEIASCDPMDSLTISTSYKMDQSFPDRSSLRIFNAAVDKVASEAKACFSSIERSTASPSNNSLHLKMDLTLHNNIPKETAIGFVGGFTFFTVPVWCTYPFSLKSTLTDGQGKELAAVNLDDYLRLWMHAFLIFYPKTPGSALREMSENLVRTVFQRLDWETIKEAKLQ